MKSVRYRPTVEKRQLNSDGTLSSVLMGGGWLLSNHLTLTSESHRIATGLGFCSKPIEG